MDVAHRSRDPRGSRPEELLRRIRELERELDGARHVAELTISQSHVPTAVVSLDGRLLQVNAAMGTLLGRAPHDLVGRRMYELLERDELARHVDLLARTISQELRGYRVEARFRRPDENVVWGDMTVTLIGDPAAPLHCLMHVVDISARLSREQDLRRQAQLDPLTQLPNRSAMLEFIDLAREEASSIGAGVGVVVLDLDGFKQINDSFGHAAGDEVLQVVAQRLQAAIRPGDIAARVGGDEFVLVCRAVTREADAIDLVDRVRNDVSRVIDLRGHELRVGASAGVHIPGRSESAADALAAADAAMYEEKRQRGAPR